MKEKMVKREVSKLFKYFIALSCQRYLFRWVSCCWTDDFPL